MSPNIENASDFQNRLNDVIYSSRAIRDRKNLKGRNKEAELLFNALLTPGRQPFIYGLRGAGKTSLALAVANEYAHVTNVHVTCAPQMNFSQIVRDLVAQGLDQNPLVSESKLEAKADGGFNLGVLKATGTAVETKSYKGVPLPESPNDAMSMLRQVAAFKGSRFCFIIDEFDQLHDEGSHLQFGLLAKIIADTSSDIKFIFCGVADDLQQIFKAHPSTLRLFEPLEVNRLAIQPCFDIMADVEQHLGLAIERETKFRISQISDGFPYFVHLIVEMTCPRSSDHRLFDSAR